MTLFLLFSKKPTVNIKKNTRLFHVITKYIKTLRPCLSYYKIYNFTLTSFLKIYK